MPLVRSLILGPATSHMCHDDLIKMDLEFHIKQTTLENNNPKLVPMAKRIMHTKFFFLLYSMLILCLMPTQSHSLTHKNDIQSLREIKHAIDPNSISKSSYLSSWDFGVDPCECTGSQFLGILCSMPLDNTSSRVTELDLDTIGYEGFLTPALGNLTELTVLNLDNNKFRGPLPATLSNLKKLTRLTVSNNFFTGMIPHAITSLKKLEFLDLSGNRLSGVIPANITSLRSLTYLSLSRNGFSGTIPELAGLWQLSTLDLSFNQFYGNLPSLPVRLRRLHFSHNIFTGHITPLKGLTHLKWLDVSDNRLTGAISKDIFSLHGVVHLNVSFNRFKTIEAIKYSGDGPMLQVLEAQGNQLKGHLPPNLVTYMNLTSVNLASNQFTGPIPKEYGERFQTSWRRMFLDHNFLSGNVPSEFAPKTNVMGSLAHNCLKCPTNVGFCKGGQRPAAECVGQHIV